jgi:hypothetical protein
MPFLLLRGHLQRLIKGGGVCSILVPQWIVSRVGSFPQTHGILWTSLTLSDILHSRIKVWCSNWSSLQELSNGSLDWYGVFFQKRVSFDLNKCLLFLAEWPLSQLYPHICWPYAHSSALIKTVLSLDTPPENRRGEGLPNFWALLSWFPNYQPGGPVTWQITQS